MLVSKSEKMAIIIMIAGVAYCWLDIFAKTGLYGLIIFVFALMAG